MDRRSILRFLLDDVERDKFISKLLGNERPIWIYTPHGYSAGKKPYGLLVLSDGGLYVNTATSPLLSIT